MSCIGCYICVLFFIQISNARPGLRIVGGKDADEEKYPYIVIIAVEGRTRNKTWVSLICSGAVLAPTWSLAAAHCFPNEKNKYAVQYSRKNYTWTPETTSKVIFVKIHPGYNEKLSRMQNDIALLKTEKILLKEYGRISALNPMTIIGHKVILFGFGDTDLNGKVSHTMDLKKPLQMIDAVVIKCGVDEMNAWNMRPGMCVARRCGNSAGLCPGDSGGPAVHPSGIVAINIMIDWRGVSFCKLRRDVNFTVGGLLPTSPYVDWVSAVIKRDAVQSNQI